MVRFKFFLFALLVLALGLAHLPLVSGPLSAQALEGASAPATVAISEVARALEARRLAVQGLALKLAASPEVAAAVQPQVVPLPRGKGIRIVEPPVGERFVSLRPIALGLVPEALKGTVILALATPDGALYAGAEGEIASDEKLDVQALVKAGGEGVVVDAFDAPHVFFSVPVLWSPDGGRPQVAATVVVGAPLLVDEKVLESAAGSSGAAALALVRGDKVLGRAGPQKALAEEALQVLQVGQSGRVVRRGSVLGLLEQLPQVKLPLLTHPEDFKGGEAPLAVGSRRALEGGLEVVAVASVQPFMSALANYQRDALFGLMGLLGFSLVWMLVMGSGRSAPAAPARKEEKKEEKKKEGKKKDKTGKKDPEAANEQAVAPVSLPPVPEPPVPSPDDFPFPAASAPPPPVPAEPFASSGGDAYPFPPAPGPDAAPGGEAFPFPPSPVQGSDPFAARASGADAFPFASAEHDPNVPSASARRGAFAFEDQPTATYSLQQAADPFAAAAAQAGLPARNFGKGSPPETTRVAPIPQELLQAARPTMTGHPGVAALASASVGEEQHFQEVFREFVATREQCGEPNDGLTYDKFVTKLRKNKEQLIQKYACKTVRFQVYVKEGKAALKATPVKD